ncbi:MAG: leucine-rich repeat domain-containing protein, partial [Chloroflexota bacterium]
MYDQFAETSFDCTTASGIVQTECEALVKIYQKTGGAKSWDDQMNWLQTQTPCEWVGVTCNDEQPKSVVELELSNRGLRGKLPSEIGVLSQLVILSLSNNRLTGLRPEIGNLAKLERLELGRNEISSVPGELGNLQALQMLYLNNNKLKIIPDGLGNLTNVTELWLHNNNLTQIPPTIGNLINLTQLRLRSNQLTEIPSELGNLTNLTELDLGNNSFKTLPFDLANLNQLTSLSLASNQLSSIPASVETMTELKKLYLDENLLKQLPETIANLQSLEELGVSGNPFETFPIDITQLTTLQLLDVSNTGLPSIPAEIGNMTSVITLDLSRNPLKILPPEIKPLVNLEYLGLNNTQLMTLSDDIEYHGNLKVLDLSQNKLTDLPTTMNNLQLLRTVHISANQLSTLPDAIGSLWNLKTLNLSNNQLTDMTEVLELTELESLILRGNQIEFIPQEIDTLTALQTLDLTDNMLENVPDTIGNLTSLQQLYLGHNKLRGEGVPSHLGNLNQLEELELNGNLLHCGYQLDTGVGMGHTSRTQEQSIQYLPVTISELTGLTNLSLDYNCIDPEDTNASLVQFFDSMSSAWADTQTVPPRNLDIAYSVDHSFRLSWFSELFAGEEGHYEIYVTDELHAQVDKPDIDNTHIVTEVLPNTVFYIRMRSYTFAHEHQKNHVWTRFSKDIHWTPDPNSTPNTPAPTSTPTTSSTPTTTSTASPIPTSTPVPTSTPTSTATSIPTFTSEPTITPTPTLLPSLGIERTLLIYAFGDSDLYLYLGDHFNNSMLSRLQQLQGVPMSNVNVVVLLDGPEIGDAAYYTLSEFGEWGVQPMGELRMDDGETLKSFLEWGFDAYPHSGYYVLSILGHANGVKGLGPDLSSNIDPNISLLSPSEIREAIQSASTEERHLDVVHFDGCSFGLLENTSIVDGLADYVIASPNTGWGIFAYDQYRAIAGESGIPKEYAEKTAKHYADTLDEDDYPFTISVFDMTWYDEMTSTVDALGKALDTYIEDGNVHERKQEIHQIRLQTQIYDSGDYRLDHQEDMYIDLIGFAKALSE